MKPDKTMFAECTLCLRLSDIITRAAVRSFVGEIDRTFPGTQSSCDKRFINIQLSLQMASSARKDLERMTSLKAKNSSRTGQVFKRGLSRMTSVTMDSYLPTIISERRMKIEDLCRDLIVNNDHINVVQQRMQLAIRHGLSTRKNSEASVKCFPTYVQHLPTGKEEGKFLALDLGGTNFRVLVIDIEKDKKFVMESKVFAISREVMEGSGEQLFDHIASCLAEFIAEQGLQDTCLPLGFTFSFPCRQEGLDAARLTTWTKGFKCSGVEGSDVVGLLREAIHRRGDVRIQVIKL